MGRYMTRKCLIVTLCLGGLHSGIPSFAAEPDKQYNIGPEASATSNSEFHNLPIYKAQNVIDGVRANHGHGPLFPSWGPDKIENPWLKLTWEQEVKIDHIRVFIRCDFPPYTQQDHDSWWESGTVELSTGEKVPFTLEKTADGQIVELPRNTVRWIKFTNLVPHEDKWCAFCEVEVVGRPTVAGSQKK